MVTYINGAQTDEVLVQDLVSQDTNVVVDCNMHGPNMENDNPYANVNRCDGRAQIDGISDDVSSLQIPPSFGPINPNSNQTFLANSIVNDEIRS